jgi:hypothetical protein
MFSLSPLGTLKSNPMKASVAINVMRDLGTLGGPDSWGFYAL